MAVETRDELRSQLKRREVAPVYVLFGPETFLRDLAARTIADIALREAQLRDFNENAFSLNSQERLADALAAANQLPMMAERRVVIVNDVRVTSTGGRDSLKEDYLDALAHYLDSPAPHSVLIFIADEFDKRRKAAKLLVDRAVAVEFSRLDDEEAVQWAKGRIRDAGFEYDDSAVRRLVSLAGDDLRRLASEIDKISTAVLPDRMIGVRAVEELVGNSRELSNFELMDHIMSRNRKRALTVLDKVLEDGAEPLMILGLIANNFHRLLMAKEMIEAGVQRAEVAKVLKLPYRMQEEFLAAARKSEREKIAGILGRVAEADLAIKTSRGGGGTAGARLQLEMLVCELVA